MQYKVWAGGVEVKFETSTKARFRWVKRTLVYDSCFESGGHEKTPAGNTQREAF